MTEPQQPDLFTPLDAPTASADEAPTFASLREVIEAYIAERKAEKLEKERKESAKHPNGPDPKKILEIEKKYETQTWLADAAKRISQIRPATHTGKHIHPSSVTSALFVPQSRVKTQLISSEVLTDLSIDVTGNAAALDIYKLLRQRFEDETLFSRLQRNDPDLRTAFGGEDSSTGQIFEAFRNFLLSPERLTAGSRAKQLYFPVDDDGYHLLTVLYPTSLVHEIWTRIRDARFGNVAKAVRQQRHAGEYSDLESHEYPDLLAQGFGGTNPQGVSQLNSDRRGTVWLLPSLPPVWANAPVPLPRKTIFGAYLRGRPVLQDAVRRMVNRLHEARADENNIELRTALYGHVQTMVDDLIELAAQLQAQEANWSIDPHTDDPLLPIAEQIWLDPKIRFDLYLIEAQGGGLLPSEQAYLDRLRSGAWADEVGQAFGTWLVAQLRHRLKKSRDEFQRLDADEVRVYGRMLADALELMAEDA